MKATKPQVHFMVKEIARAKNIAKTLGIACAAKYLKNRDWSLEAALFILVGK